MDRQFKRRIVFGVTTGGLLAGGGLGFAHADTAAPGGSAGGTHDSPGILSGNSIQIPVDVPINVCGVTADVIGVLNPAAGNHCSNAGGATATTEAAGATTAGGATAQGGTHGSPGIASGNNVQIPIDVPVNVCGDTVSVVGIANGALGNYCANGGGNHGATAHGGAHGSPGIGSGNNVQIPIDVPVNVCGDTVSVVGVLDSALGNACANGGPHTPTPPHTPPHTPVPPPHSCPPSSPTSPLPPPPTSPTTPTTPPTTPTTPPTGPTTPTGGSTTGQVGGSTPTGGTLAHTGAEGLILGPIGAALIGGGTVLYRRTRQTGTH